MDDEPLKAYVKAGEIAYRVKQAVASLVRPGVSLLEIAGGVERMIRDLGGEPAFPTNISVGEVAAHRTPYADDAELIPEGAVVKVDIGVHVNGYIADTAVTLAFNDRAVKLVEAAREALAKALKLAAPGTPLNSFGRVIEATARSYGLNVVKNLSGHSLGRYLIHAGEVIPNHATMVPTGRMVSGRAYAVEPFITEGKGYVEEIRGSVQIYALTTNVKSLKRLSGEGVRLAEVLGSRFRTLPFCERWLKDIYPDLTRLRTLLQDMVRKSALVSYPVLREVSGRPVSQFEETVVVWGGDVIVTTNPGLSI
ncbi:MAG: type II methionyl aminopeptidase [Zestosphaera sp.]